ncbi:DNA polymerase I [Cryomorphaceae bacterium 1068]|nr:DNA polymerase I [Cryomorphaceae bacterium 1068]
MSQKRPTLYLLDAYALIYRAYYAFIRNPRVNSKGMNTSAMFGFTNTLNDLIKNYGATHIAVAFDVPGDVFRNETFPEYKANREETPDDIKMSIPYIRKIIEGFRIPIIEMAGFEADDVVGTIARQAEKEGFDVFMVTPDKDYGQLVTEHSKMLKPGRQGNASEVWGIKEICEKFGIERTEQVIDILGLQGDAVDNIPGVPGVGPKTAMKLIADYGTVEGVLEHSDELKGKLKERIQENKEQALLSKELATINCEVPVKFVAEEVILEEPDREALREIFADLEFRTMSERILGEKMASSGEQVVSSGAQMDLFSGGGDTVHDAEEEIVTTMEVFDPEKVSYSLIETKDKRTTFLTNLMRQRVVCFDTETTSVDANNCELVGMSFSWKEGEAYYIPIPENQAGAKFILKEFKPFFGNKDILKIGHNLKYDITVLKWYDMEVSGPIFDTMIAHYLINPDMKHNMDELSETYLGYRPISIETLIGKKGKNQKSMRDIPVEEVAPYANEDADITYRLYTIFKKKVEESDELKNLLYDVEMPLVAVLAKMEFAGVKIDKEGLFAFSKELEQIIVDLEKEIYKLAGKEFNIGSPKQLGVILFDELEIDSKPKKTKSGQYSTNEETLLKYEHDQPIVSKLLEYRQVVKLKSTYVDSLPELINPKDQRIHTTYMQAVAATGRLSSQNPNLQNIPIRTELGRRTREAFIPTDENHIIFAADYSQIELRLIAHLSGDEAMVKAFNDGEDIHAATAAKVFDVDIEEVTREMRSQAKMVNFGIIYGISAFGLSQRLHVSRTEASDLIKNYFAKYPGIKIYMDESITFAREHGYVETILKRRRYLKDINGKNPTVRGFAERNAINAPIQGSAADMIKVAMVRLNEVFEKEGFKSKMILQVHDELVFDAQKDELDKIGPIVEKEMMNAFTGLSVPMKVDMDTGENWLEAH